MLKRYELEIIVRLIKYKMIASDSNFLEFLMATVGLPVFKNQIIQAAIDKTNLTALMLTLRTDIKNSRLEIDNEDIAIVPIQGFDMRSPEIKESFAEINSFLTKFENKTSITVGEFSYNLGMILRLLLFLSSPLERIILFDDDIKYLKSNSLDLNLSKHILTQDIIFLGASQHSWSNVIIENKYYVPNEDTYGTFALIMSKKSARFYLLNLLPMTDAADRKPLKDLTKYPTIQSMVIFPNAIIADVSSSLIRKPRDEQKHSILMKWNLDEYYSLNYTK